MNTIVLGQHVQGLIAGAMLAKAGHTVDVLNFPDSDYAEFYDGCKTGPVAHVPVAIPVSLIDDLDLKNYGFELPRIPLSNPFEKLPFYEGLKRLVDMFIGLETSRPSYKEKAWRDTWNTFEIARVLSEQDDAAQALFARSATLSLIELLDATSLSAGEKAEIVAYSVVGSKTDPAAKGSAAAILPAMAIFEKKNHILLCGSLHPLVRALKQAAMAYGANVVVDDTITNIYANESGIQSVTLSGGQEIEGAYYVLDYDPVSFFADYLENYNVPLLFKKRIAPEQNTQECLHVKMALSRSPEALDQSHIFLATDEGYIARAKDDMVQDGGSQFPMLSIVNISRKNPSLANDNVVVIDVIAQYFEPGLQDLSGGPLMAVQQALTKAFPEIEGAILSCEIAVPPTQLGQANFVGAMPLLQLFKVFGGYHSMGYDMPIDNLLVAGYGAGTAGHYHVNDGGERIAKLLQSL